MEEEQSQEVAAPAEESAAKEDAKCEKCSGALNDEGKCPTCDASSESSAESSEATKSSESTEATEATV